MFLQWLGAVSGLCSGLSSAEPLRTIASPLLDLQAFRGTISAMSIMTDSKMEVCALHLYIILESITTYCATARSGTV